MQRFTIITPAHHLIYTSPTYAPLPPPWHNNIYIQAASLFITVDYVTSMLPASVVMFERGTHYHYTCIHYHARTLFPPHTATIIFITVYYSIPCLISIRYVFFLFSLMYCTVMPLTYSTLMYSYYICGIFTFHCFSFTSSTLHYLSLFWQQSQHLDNLTTSLRLFLSWPFATIFSVSCRCIFTSQSDSHAHPPTNQARH